MMPNHVMTPGEWYVAIEVLPEAEFTIHHILRQRVRVTPNTVYEAAIWARGTGRFIIDIAYGDELATLVLPRFEFDLTPEWKRHSFTFNTGTHPGSATNMEAPGRVSFSIRETWSADTINMDIDDAFFGLPGGANLLINNGFEDGRTNWVDYGWPGHTITLKKYETVQTPQ